MNVLKQYSSVYNNPIIIDTDAGADDIVALYTGIKANLPIQSIVTTYGNYSRKIVERRISTLLTKLKSNIPINAGESQPLHERYDESYSVHGPPEQFLTKFYFTRPNTTNSPLVFPTNPTTYITLGPLTSLAKALQTGKPHNITKIIIIGGALMYPGNATPYAEANFFWDPDAARIVLNAGIPIELIPLNITDTLDIRIAAFKTMGLPSFITNLITEYENFYEQKKQHVYKTYINKKATRFHGGAYHDLVAILRLISPSTVPCKKQAISITEINHTRGHITPILRGEPMNSNQHTVISVAYNLNVKLAHKTLRSIYRQRYSY